MIVHALDLLYFWMYQPRARTALTQFAQTLTEDERHILASSQFTLQRHREISQMFIDGILGNDFPRPLSFYLERHPEYLERIKSLVFGKDGPGIYLVRVGIGSIARAVENGFVSQLAKHAVTEVCAHGLGSRLQLISGRQNQAINWALGLLYTAV